MYFGNDCWCWAGKDIILGVPMLLVPTYLHHPRAPRGVDIDDLEFV